MKKLVGLGIFAFVSAALNVFLVMRRERHELPDPPFTVAERAALDDKMGRHGDDMTDLLFSVVARDHVTTGQLAEALAARRLPRAVVKSARFGELEEELRARAHELAAAAATRDDARVSGAYGQLLGACAGCHARYHGGVL